MNIVWVFDWLSYAHDISMWSNSIHGLVQERRKSIADALELRLSCTNLSICGCNSLWHIVW